VTQRTVTFAQASPAHLTPRETRVCDILGSARGDGRSVRRRRAGAAGAAVTRGVRHHAHHAGHAQGDAAPVLRGAQRHPAGGGP